MDYLNYEGLKYYHSKITGLINKVTNKIPDYKAGDNITITDNVISAEVPEYQAGSNITIEDGVISAEVEIPEYTAGENITIEEGVISANVDDSVITEPEIDELFAPLYAPVCYYTVDLNNQWQLSSTAPNPDSTVYEGVYESFAHRGQDSTLDIMYIDIYGYETFKFYIRSYAEGSCDYVKVAPLDGTLTLDSTSYASTSGKQNSDTSISGYTLVQFNNIDGGEHRIAIGFRKDNSQSQSDDRGYVLIPKNQ